MPQIDRERLERALIAADKAGDVEAARLLAQELKKHPEGKWAMQAAAEAVGEPALMIAEPALTMGSSMIAEPVAGLAGAAAAPFVGGERAGQIVRDVQSSMTYQPRTEPGQRSAQAIGSALALPAEVIGAVENAAGDLGERTAGPVGGAIGKTVPTAFGLAFGAGPYMMRRATKAFPNKPAGTRVEPEIPVQPPLPAPKQVIASTLKDLSRHKAEVAAETVMPDAAVLDASKRLNIDLNPSHYSQNPTSI